MRKKNLFYSSAAIVITTTATLLAYSYTHKNNPFIADESKLSEQQLLGKKIFEDTNLSEPRGVSCASCHDPKKAFQGNNNSSIASIAKGSRDGLFGGRNVPTAAYAAFTPSFHFAKEKDDEGKEDIKAIGGQFLDGRAPDLATQAGGPLLNPKEMNNSSKAAVVEKVKNAPYAQLMTKLYGVNAFDNIDSAFTNITQSIAAFENSHYFAPFSSKFDRVLLGKDKFNEQEAKGFSLFKDPKKGNCLACHTGKEDSKEPRDWLFTDYSYDALGVPRNHAIPENSDANHYDLGLCKQEGIEKTAPKEVDVKTLCGAFKVPTLRNIAITAPYMHNGVFSNLRDAVKFYATRDTNPELWYGKNPDGSTNKYDDTPKKYQENINTTEVPYNRKAGEKPSLTDEEIDALVAFLKTLSDE